MSPLVVHDAPVVGGDDANSLGRVYRAAAADRDKAVATLRAVLSGSRVDELHAGIGLDPIEHDGFDI